MEGKEEGRKLSIIFNGCPAARRQKKKPSPLARLHEAWVLGTYLPAYEYYT